MEENLQSPKNNSTNINGTINQETDIINLQTDISKTNPNSNLAIVNQALKGKKAKTLKTLGILCLIFGIIYSLFIIYTLSQQCQGGEEGAVCGLTAAMNLFWTTITFGPICLILFITCIIMKIKNHIELNTILIPPFIGVLLPLILIGIATL